MIKLFLYISIALFSSLSFSATTLNDIESNAKKGDVDAQIKMGLAYERGVGDLYADVMMAEYWYEKAYKKGDLRAASRLAYLEMEDGDNEAAKRYLKEGLKARFPYALYLYGLIMINEENSQGEKFIEFAAKRGVRDALYDYANFKKRDGDVYKAYIYSKLAVLRRHNAAVGFSNELLGELTSNQLLSATKTINRLNKEMLAEKNKNKNKK